MKKVLAIIVSCLIVLSLAGCGVDNSVNINVANSDELPNTKFGKSALVEIGDFLWYDSTTRIVYWWSGHLTEYRKDNTTPSPYYAPNGLPYRYNPETNTFEEIEYGCY